MLNPVGKPNAVDELVVFQETQTLPPFVVKLKSDAKFVKNGEKPTIFNNPKSQTPDQVFLLFFLSFPHF